MSCSICKNPDIKLKHLPLYVTGSEGLDVCYYCEMIIVEFIRKMINLAAYSYLLGKKEVKTK